MSSGLSNKFELTEAAKKRNIPLLMVDNDQAATTRRTTREHIVLLAGATICLCLVIVVAGTLLLLATDEINVDELGKVTEFGVGGGLVGLASVLVAGLVKLIEVGGN